MTLPRVFVGTLHSNEGDFEKCCEMIKSQQNVEVTHEIISGLNERDAHNALWNAWKKEQPRHDVFVKVDADTVLASVDTLSTICNTLSVKQATGLQAPLHDYMTDGLINGLNAYASTVVFSETIDDLFCDRNICEGNTKIVRDLELPDSLKPAGFHGHHGTYLQAYHYGVHRLMKGQKEILFKVIDAHRKHRDMIRGIAIIGAVSAGMFMKDGKHPGRYNYTDEEFLIKCAATVERYEQIMQRNSLEQFQFLIDRAITVWNQ